MSMRAAAPLTLACDGLAGDRAIVASLSTSS